MTGSRSVRLNLNLGLKDVVFLMAALVLASLWWRQYRESERVGRALSASQDKVRIWKDEAGRSNAQIQALELTYTEFRANQAQVIDSLKSLNIRPKSVREATTVATSYVDTVYYRVGSPQVSFLDSGFVYNYSDSLALIKHSIRYGFLGLKERYVVRAISFNPKTTITGLDHVSIVPRQRRLGLGFYAGYGFVLSGGEVRTGFGAGAGILIRL